MTLLAERFAQLTRAQATDLARRAELLTATRRVRRSVRPVAGDVMAEISSLDHEIRLRGEEINHTRVALDAERSQASARVLAATATELQSAGASARTAHAQLRAVRESLASLHGRLARAGHLSAEVMGVLRGFERADDAMDRARQLLDRLAIDAPRRVQDEPKGV